MDDQVIMQPFQRHQPPESSSELTPGFLLPPAVSIICLPKLVGSYEIFFSRATVCFGDRDEERTSEFMNYTITSTKRTECITGV
jgi:hypothetical protein